MDEKTFVAKLATAIATVNGHHAPEEWGGAVAEAFANPPPAPAPADADAPDAATAGAGG